MGDCAQPDKICRFLLGIIIDIQIPNAPHVTTSQLVRAVRGQSLAKAEETLLLDSW